jgi:tetratricopeptide (TPR) repeat protein
LLYHLMGDYPAALAHAQGALELAQEIGAIILVAKTWPILGVAHEGLGNLDQAAEAYQQALSIYSARNLSHWVPEPLAGLARLHLAQGDLPQAQAHVGQILSYLDSKTLAADGEQEAIDPFTGAWELQRIYLTCYQVLKAAGDSRAEAILRRGYERLQASAATIKDDDRRRSFFENVSANRELLRAWEER